MVDSDEDFDPECHRIFREEARQHLGTVRLWLDTHPSNENGRLPVTHELLRAVHT